MSIAKKLNNMYYGWFIVIGLALVTFLDFGARASFGVYVHEWEKEFERAINWNDKEIGIDWPIMKNNKYLLSNKDRIAPFLNKAKLLGEIFS